MIDLSNSVTSKELTRICDKELHRYNCDVTIVARKVDGLTHVVKVNVVDMEGTILIDDEVSLTAMGVRAAFYAELSCLLVDFIKIKAGHKPHDYRLDS